MGPWVTQWPCIPWGCGLESHPWPCMHVELHVLLRLHVNHSLLSIPQSLVECGYVSVNARGWTGVPLSCMETELIKSCGLHDTIQEQEVNFPQDHSATCSRCELSNDC